MNFNSIKAILFDLGDVIINIDFALTYQAFQKLTDKNLDEVYEQFHEHQIWERYETGELSSPEFLTLLKERLEITATDEVLLKAWNALLLDIPKKRIDLIQKLATNYRLLILSNTSHYHIQAVNQILNTAHAIPDLKQLVHKVYYSYEMGLRKPDPAIYQQVLDQEGLLAHEVVFLDDNKENIDSAQQMGIHTIWVQKPTDICQYLLEA